MADAPATTIQSRPGAWRGESGRVYDVAVLGLGEAAHGSVRGCAGLAVRRDKKGIAIQVDRPARRITPEWIEAALKGGAAEIHVLQLADDEVAAALSDLQGMG